MDIESNTLYNQPYVRSERLLSYCFVFFVNTFQSGESCVTMTANQIQYEKSMMKNVKKNYFFYAAVSRFKYDIHQKVWQNIRTLIKRIDVTVFVVLKNPMQSHATVC